MENQNRLKQRISRMFRSSFGSCKSRNISDVVIEQPAFVPRNGQRGQLIELFSPNTHPFPSVCRPKCSETASEELFPSIPEASDGDFHLLPVGIDGGRRCPPTSPISSLNRVHEFDESEAKPKKERSRKKKNEKNHLIANSDYYYGWFGSDADVSEAGEYDKTSLFSSKSLSSDSPDSFGRDKEGRRAASEVGLIPLQEKVRDSFVVVKHSNDPYNDFKVSMVEMIVEKEIFGAKELENLLHTFLSLNSHHHHRVIIQVFTEIWDRLSFN